MRSAALTAALRAIGPRWQQDIRAAGVRTKALYEPLLAEASARQCGIQIDRDIPYGTHPRQILDVYRPMDARGAAVVVFVHGGAFIRGTKDTSVQMWSNVLRWFAQQGFVGVNVEYRLADAADYPGGAQDVARACGWVQAHIDKFGGTPHRVCLMGHSAGGTHVASYACDPVMGCNPKAHALVLVSARLRADVRANNPNAQGVRAYFGVRADQLDGVSPVTYAAGLTLPVLIVNAQYENPWLDVYGLEFALAIGQARGVAPLHVTMADHNHVSIVAHFNSGERWLGDQIVEFFARATGDACAAQ